MLDVFAFVRSKEDLKEGKMYFEKLVPIDENWYMFHNLRQGDSSDKRFETGSTARLGLTFNSTVLE